MLIKATKGEDVAKEMGDLSSHFGDDVCPTSLGAQLSTFKVLISEHDTEVECFQDIIDEVKALNEHERNLIDQVARICKLVHVNPATSSTGERSFSTTRRVKTWLCSQMNQARFTHLSVLNTHKARLDKICLVSVANAFVSLNDNRKRNLGKFAEVDFH